MRNAVKLPRIMSKIGLLLVLGLALLQSVSAAQLRPADAADLVRETFDEATAALQANQQKIEADPRVAKELMREILGPRVDFELLSRLVLARHWRTATPEERERFVATFTGSLIDTYAVVLSENMDQIMAQLARGEELLTVQPIRASEDAQRVTVQTQMSLNDGSISVDYALHATDQGWRVFDVIIEGVSFVTSRRSEFAGLLQRQSLEQLIRQLEGNG